MCLCMCEVDADEYTMTLFMHFSSPINRIGVSNVPYIYLQNFSFHIIVSGKVWRVGNEYLCLVTKVSELVMASYAQLFLKMTEFLQ